MQVLCVGFYINPAVGIWMLWMVSHISKHNKLSERWKEGKTQKYLQSSLHLQDCSRKKRACLLKNLPDPSFVNLMQDKITSDDSIIRHHYQHQNVWPGAGGCAASVTGWYGLHFVKRPCTPLIFYACQSNAVMTASMTSFPNKTQISLWWLRSLTLLHTSHPLMILTNPASGGVEVGQGQGFHIGLQWCLGFYFNIIYI